MLQTRLVSRGCIARLPAEYVFASVRTYIQVVSFGCHSRKLVMARRFTQEKIYGLIDADHGTGVILSSHLLVRSKHSITLCRVLQPSQFKPLRLRSIDSFTNTVLFTSMNTQILYGVRDNCTVGSTAPPNKTMAAHLYSSPRPSKQRTILSNFNSIYLHS